MLLLELRGREQFTRQRGALLYMLIRSQIVSLTLLLPYHQGAVPLSIPHGHPVTCCTSPCTYNKAEQMPYKPFWPTAGSVVKLFLTKN